jgi:hypothetical protein
MYSCITGAHAALDSPWERQVGIVQKDDSPVAGYHDVPLFSEDRLCL